MTQEEFFIRYSYDLDEDYLGGGGFGKVFKAFDEVRDRWIALKIAEVKPGMEQLSLQKEVELSSQLPEHTNIAHYEACHQFRTPHGVFDYGILQYYPVGNLSELIKTKKLTLAQKESIARGILAGIKHLHDHNIIHRDLKSSNILISQRGDQSYVPKITYFGLSKMLSDANQTHYTKSFAGGSLLYVAPEQLAGQVVRRNVDLWSYGVVLYELFTNRTPFYPESAEINSETGRTEVVSKIAIGKIPSAISSIPEPWQSVIRKCLIPDTKLRAVSVNAILSLLQGAISENKIVSILKERDSSSDNTTISTNVIGSQERKHPGSTFVYKHRIKLLISISIIFLCILIIFVFYPFNNPKGGNVSLLKTHSSWFQYSVVRKGISTVTIPINSYVFFNMSLTQKDSVIQSTPTTVKPDVLKLMEDNKSYGQLKALVDVMATLHVGDSMLFYFPLDSFVNLPPGFDKFTEPCIYHVGIVDVMDEGRFQSYTDSIERESLRDLPVNDKMPEILYSGSFREKTKVYMDTYYYNNSVSCGKDNGVWDAAKGMCYFESNNLIEISNKGKRYFVKISTKGPNVHKCEYEGSAQLISEDILMSNNNKEAEFREVNIFFLDKNSVRVESNKDCQYFCGFHGPLKIDKAIRE